MRSTRKNQRKALKALALGFATAAIFTTTASAQVRSEAASQRRRRDLVSQLGRDGRRPGPVRGAAGRDPVPERGRRPRGRQLRRESRADRRRRRQPLRRRRHADEPGSGVSPDRAGRRAAGRLPAAAAGRRTGDHPRQARRVPAADQDRWEATVSASSDSGLDRGDLALGFGLGLILATACAIALAMTRDRQQTRMAHS